MLVSLSICKKKWWYLNCVLIVMRLHWDPGGKSASMIPDGWNSLSAFALLLLFFVTVVFVVSLELPLQLSWWRICLRCTRPGFSPWVGKIPWRRKWPPTPAFLPGEPHGQRGLAGCGPRDRKSQTRLSAPPPDLHGSSRCNGEGGRSHPALQISASDLQKITCRESSGIRT